MPHLRSRKGYWLLALLALRANREVERKWLDGLLWPESAADLASRSLRTSLNDLRRAMGSEAARLQSPTPRTLMLDLRGPRWTSSPSTTPSFGALRSVAGRGGGISTGARCWRGARRRWALEERHARELAFLAALESLAARALQAGDGATAVSHLRRVVTADPLREGAQRALMQALAAGGNYAAALLLYRDLRYQLYRELNTSPDPETQALFAAIQTEAEQKSAGRPFGRSHPPRRPGARRPITCRTR